MCSYFFCLLCLYFDGTGQVLDRKWGREQINMQQRATGWNQTVAAVASVGGAPALQTELTGRTWC